MDLLLDYFFTAFHGSLVVFNIVGWAFRRTRRLHLVTISLTIASWFGLGVFFGFGYCPCTDWHWNVKRKLGETDLPNSYIKYSVDKLTGFYWDATLVDVATVTLGVSALALSCWLNWRDFQRDKS